MWTFKKDFDFWLANEWKVLEYFKELWRKIEPTEDTAILDFKIVDKNWNTVHLELKTRRWAKDDYPDSMIWANKIIEALKRYNEKGEYTLFLFKFTDWLYYINPFFTLPRYDYRKWRWDRWNLDKEKAWAYYLKEDLILLTK